jgi:hypothetical protein
MIDVNKFNMCEDCTFPPNFVCEYLPPIEGDDEECSFIGSRYGVTCRDCGDYWEEEHEE